MNTAPPVLPEHPEPTLQGSGRPSGRNQLSLGDAEPWGHSAADTVTPCPRSPAAVLQPYPGMERMDILHQGAFPAPIPHTYACSPPHHQPCSLRDPTTPAFPPHPRWKQQHLQGEPKGGFLLRNPESSPSVTGSQGSFHH